MRPNQTHLFRAAIVLCVAFLSACGSVSKLQRAEGTQNVSMADFDVVYVEDFKDATDVDIKNEKKRAAYDETLRLASIKFADMIAEDIAKTKNPPQVLRVAPTDGMVLRIEGDITVFDRGLAIARILPIVGGSEFNAEVRFIDHQTETLLGQIIVDKNSNPIGGWYAITQTANRFMSGASGKVADQLHLARNPKR